MVLSYLMQESRVRWLVFVASERPESPVNLAAVGGGIATPGLYMAVSHLDCPVDIAW